MVSGQTIARPTVGEASLPGGTTPQKWVDSGEYVGIDNISPSNHPLKNNNVAGD